MLALLPKQWEKRLFIVVLLASITFLLYPTYLPMVDLPQHAAQIVLLDDLFTGKSVWQDEVQINWDTPYLTTYLLWWGLYRLLGIVWSSKVLVVGILLAYVWAMVCLRRAFSGSRLVDWAALGTFFGFAFQFGFVSFLAAIPLGIALLLLAKHWLDKRRTPRDLWAMCLLGITLYCTHVLIFCFFCFLTYAYFLFRQCLTNQKLSIDKCLYFTLPFMGFAALLVRYLSKPDVLAFRYYSVDVVYHTVWEKTQALLFMPWGIETADYYDIAFMWMWLLPPLLGFRLRRDVAVYALPLGFLAIWYALPHIAFQTAFVYQRFALFALPFYYLLWQAVPWQSNWRFSLAQVSTVGLICALAILLGKTYGDILRFEHHAATKQFKQILSLTQSHKRMFAMFDTYGSERLKYLYFANWYQAQKHGWSDFSFVVFHPQMVRFKPERLPKHYGKYRAISSDDLENLDKVSCRHYDYLLLHTEMPASVIQNRLFANTSCGQMKLLSATGAWVLFGQ